MMEPLLTIDNLHIEFRTSFGTIQALNGLSLEVHSGEVFGMVGETGCGKTVSGLSVLRLLPRSARVTAGRIIFNGKDLLKQSEGQMQDIRGREIATIFQDPASSLNPVFTIEQQMMGVIGAHFRMTRDAARKHITELLEAVGLPDPTRILRSYPHQLSGGMQQRVMIAQALSCHPLMLIADEPTTALDVTIQAQLLTMLRNLQHQFGLTVVLITHNLGIVAETCNHLAVLYAGRVVEQGSTREVFENPQHPYTRGLLAASPGSTTRGSKLVPIPGSVPPNPGAITGCAFASRCAQVLGRCRSEQPRLVDAGLGHQSACFLVKGA